MLHEKALSKKQQRFFGIVRASQKGTLKGEASPQVQRVAASMKKKDVKKFASTKHKGLPEKKITKEETCGKGEYYCNDDQKCKPIPKGMKVEKDGYLVKELNMREGNLHKWFKGSKSKDGKGGWVNVKTGGTCASDEPGEGTPKCVSSSKRASMSKAERESASRRKKAADPNQQQKSGAAKPTYVSTDKPKKKMKESFSTNKYKEMAKREADLKRKEDLKVKTKKEETEVVTELKKSTYGSYIKKASTQMATSAIKGDYKKTKKRQDGVMKASDKLSKEEVVVESDKKGKGSGKKDACYKKVKASASVWPSAYASGRLVQCRKKGAANYGNSKKESYNNKSFSDFMDECWKTHKKVGMKMKGGKLVPDCRPKNEAVETEKKPKKAMDAGARGRRLLKRREYKAKVSEFVPKELEDHVVYENDALIGGINKAAEYVQKSNNPIVKAVRKVFQVKGGKNYPTKKEYQNQIQNNSYEPESQVLEASAAWQKKSGKNSKGGLNEKGRKSYEAQNPGSDLKAPVTGKVKAGGKAAKRRKSFCARMGGMKGPMKKPNGKPTRKALALRKWKC